MLFHDRDLTLPQAMLMDWPIGNLSELRRIPTDIVCPFLIVNDISKIILFACQTRLQSCLYTQWRLMGLLGRM
jgi:hypothetical protein